MKIQNVALIGAGAIGGYILYGMDGSDVSYRLIAEGSRKERLRAEGLLVNDKHLYPEVLSPEEAGVQDLIIISVKYAALRDAVEMARKMLGEHTLVLSVLNGIDSEEIVAAELGREHVLHSLMKVASRRFPDRIEFVERPEYGIYYGNVYLPEEEGKEAVQAVTEMFDRTSFTHFPKEDILYEQWFKYAGNVSSNLPQAIIGVGNGMYYDSEHGEAIRDRLWREVAALAKVYGVQLPETSEPWVTPYKARFSTLQDLDAKRKTEIDMFAGTLVRKSKEAGLEAPFAEYTYHAIRLLEEKNDGRFDYDD